ncbi:hypothetical protein F1_00023 [Ralstonia phage Heva]|uniref:Uncharacterized protein n=3 Tax=Cimandefvirus TaxID=2843366 RepID=A0A7G5BAR3_9CAUD|nr:endonuclease [Ralstonia phage Cimandef]YP_010078386.1 endonuclease [Ralstonia phage Gamede]YP_010078493.1 endonuclease [Ralstonia phage Heva]QMV32651.1 hypothetical protein B2_00017 [Ralstonia phage Cimandef]QMV33386.1 hypothetical protein F1_00023 [Ralstonia phage Heva]QOQ37820.1 hypothetical protein 9Ga_00059 [Ralstonia phage Gamede]
MPCSEQRARKLLSAGRLIPWSVCAIPECSEAPEAHHPDYSRPLDVVWLCDHHHKETHKMAREIERQEAA